MRHFDVEVNLGGMLVNVYGTYTPPRTAPAIDPHNYDATKCDPGADEELEILHVKTTAGHAIDFEESDFIENWRDQIVEAINDQYYPYRQRH